MDVVRVDVIYLDRVRQMLGPLHDERCNWGLQLRTTWADTELDAQYVGYYPLLSSLLSLLLLQSAIELIDHSTNQCWNIHSCGRPQSLPLPGHGCISLCLFLFPLSFFLTLPVLILLPSLSHFRSHTLLVLCPVGVNGVILRFVTWFTRRHQSLRWKDASLHVADSLQLALLPFATCHLPLARLLTMNSTHWLLFTPIKCNVSFPFAMTAHNGLPCEFHWKATSLLRITLSLFIFLLSLLPFLFFILPSPSLSFFLLLSLSFSLYFFLFRSSLFLSLSFYPFFIFPPSISPPLRQINV